MRTPLPWAMLPFLLLVGGCGLVPAMPEELPTDLVPEVEAPRVDDPAALSDEGVAAAERMAIRVRNVGCGELSTGSGFALDDHTVVTNRHVATEADRLQVTTHDGREIEAMAASITEVADLALLRTEEPLSSIPGLAEEEATVGTDVTVVGYPQGAQLSTAKGTVLGYEEDPLGADMGMVGRTNATVDHGSSGSAVLDEDGTVIGVVYAMDGWGNSYMVPTATLAELVSAEAFSPITSCSQQQEDELPEEPSATPPSWEQDGEPSQEPSEAPSQ